MIKAMSSNSQTDSRRRLPPPWTLEEMENGFKVRDANGISLAYVYGSDILALAERLTMDEARRIAANIAKLPDLLTSDKSSDR